MRDNLIVAWVLIIMLLITIAGIAVVVLENKKIKMPNDIEIRQRDYEAMSDKFSNYRYIKVCDLETGKCDVMTKLPEVKQ